MKTKILAVSFLLITLLLVGQYFLLPGWFRKSGIEISGWLMMLSMSLAIALSLWLIHELIQKFCSKNSRPSRIGSYIGGYGLFPFALFLGVVVGGNFGGAIGNTALGDVGTVIGIGVGIFVVAIVICAAGATIGSLLGGLTHRLVK